MRPPLEHGGIGGARCKSILLHFFQNPSSSRKAFVPHWAAFKSSISASDKIFTDFIQRCKWLLFEFVPSNFLCICKKLLIKLYTITGSMSTGSIARAAQSRVASRGTKLGKYWANLPTAIYVHLLYTRQYICYIYDLVHLPQLECTSNGYSISSSAIISSTHQFQHQKLYSFNFTIRRSWLSQQAVLLRIAMQSKCNMYLYKW